MRRKFSSKPHRLPGLFDNLDDFSEHLDKDFEIIPPERMSDIAKAHAGAPEIDELPPLEASDRVFFMSFGSGSSGNCAYIGDRHYGFLIDAGIDAKKVTDALKANGIAMDRVLGIILTHDHHDHISQAYSLLRTNRHIKLYCTPRTLNGILRRHNISRRIKDYHSPIYKEFPFRIGAFEITPFEVMHDGADNAGFYITHGDRSIAVATDLGCISPRVDYYMRTADTIIIEANYDLRMLREGAYPEYLKARIAADNGHLDNTVAARFIADIMSPKLRNLYLCHLSNDNNTPHIAIQAIKDAIAPTQTSDISAIGDTDSLRLMALPRYEVTPLYTI